VLFQGGTTSDYTLFPIGITIGPLMREVVETITAFAKGIFKTTKDKTGIEEVEIGDGSQSDVNNIVDITLHKENNPHVIKQRLKDILMKSKIRDYVAVTDTEEKK
jgi:hypothetical protein